MPILKTKKILNRLERGDPEAFNQIFDQYYRKVYTFCLRVFRNRENAEEAVQEVFFHVWKDRKKLKDLKDLEAWIFSVCFNIIRKHFRKLAVEKRHLQAFADNIIESDRSAYNEAEYLDLLDKIDGLVERLPPRQKTIFLLSVNDTVSNLEISRKLNISVRTVENQLSRAKTYIKNALLSG